MNGLDNNSNCLNFSANEIQKFKYLSIFSIVGILLLVPALILQLFFMYRYKSTFLHRQFLYATIVVIIINIIYIVYPSSLNVGCPLFYLILDSSSRYIIYVEILQMTTIHLLLLYKLCKHMQTRTMQRLQTLCCNIRPRLWHEVMIVCIQLGLPLPILITDLVAILKTSLVIHKNDFDWEFNCFMKPLLAVNTLLGLICIVLLVVWFGMLWKRKLLKNKLKFVCTQMGHIFFVLVVFLIWNVICLFAIIDHDTVAHSALRAIAPISFGVYFIMSLPSLQRKVTTKAQVPVTNHHTNPPSTRVSLPTGTAEHAPNFLSPSTAEPSEVTLLINN